MSKQIELENKKYLFRTANGEYSLFAVLTVMVMMASYWVIDHDWIRSSQAFGIDNVEYTGNENNTADRLGQVNASSTISRLILASWGVLCFLTAGSAKLRWDSFLLWMSLAFLVMLLASVSWSIQPKLSLFKFAVLLAVVISAVGLAYRFPTRQLIEMICFVCVFFIGMGVLAETALGLFRPWRGEYRFIGTSHPNTLAIYAAILCMSARMFLVQGQSRMLALVVLTIGVVVILLAKSRTTLAAVSISMLVTQILSVRGSNRLLLILGGMLVIGVVAISSLFLNQQDFGQLENAAAMGRGDDVSSLTGRLPLWEELITSINKRPWLGYGYLAYWDANRVDYLSNVFKWEIPHGHNAYLDVCLDVGMIGLAIYVVWLLSALGASLRRYNKTGEIEFAIIFGLIIFAMVNSFGESLFKLPTFHLFALLCFLSSLVVVRESEREIVRESEREVGEDLHKSRRVNATPRTNFKSSLA